MKIAVICIKQYLNVHPSIKTIFPDYDLFQSDSNPESIKKVCNRIKPFYTDILITSHNISYKSSKSYIMEYHPLDYIGGDYYGIPYGNLSDIFTKTCDDPIALGFNNKGYIKKEIIRQNLVKNDYLGPNGGSYLYSSKIDTDETKCNIYLPSPYLELLSKLNFTRVKVIPGEKTLKIAVLMDGYLGGLFYTKDSLRNIIQSSAGNLSFSIFASCYPVMQSGSTNTVSSEKLYKELSYINQSSETLSNKNLNIVSHEVSEYPEPEKLFKKYVDTFGTKFDLIVNMKFNTVVDKEINYFEFEPSTIYQSNNKALTIYLNGIEKNKDNIKKIPARSVDYDIDKSFTFVTCLLDIGREKWNIGSKKFSEYIDTLVKLTEYKNFRFYIYADEYYMDKISRKLNNCANFKLIPISFKELFTYKYYDKINSVMNSEFYLAFLKHLGNTKVPEYCIPEYNTLLNCKVDLLYKASLCNTYNTDYFMWIDLFDGINSTTGESNNIIPTYWNPLCMQHPDHVMVCNQESIDNANKSYLSYFKDCNNVIMTNIFGGSQQSISELHNKYYSTLADCLDKNITHNDKFIMTMCFKNNPKLFKVFSLKDDVLNSTTLSYNYFRLINTYRVALVLKSDSFTSHESIEKFIETLDNLKETNCKVDIFTNDEREELKNLNQIKFSSIQQVPNLLDDKLLTSGRYDCVIIVSKFSDTDKLNKRYIEDCIKQNTIILLDNIIYGSYKTMIKAIW